jgi:acyl-CoA dehydrogenase
MPHVKGNFMQAWLRLVGMKLYQRRATDYFRKATADDRRYLLFNPTSKMKVTTQSEDVIALLWDVIAAKGFERDTFFATVASDIKGPAKLEGTVHVNVQLIRKFIKRYFFNPMDYAPVGPVFDQADDLFLFNQGTASGLGKVQFNDYRPVFDEFKSLPNVSVFIKQIGLFREMLEKAFPDKVQEMDPSFSLTVGEMFSIVVYGQLILEQAKIDNLDKDIVNQIFDFMVRDFSGFGLQIYAKATTNEVQRGYCKEIMLMMPVPDPAQYDGIWQTCVICLNGEYEMTDRKG